MGLTERTSERKGLKTAKLAGYGLGLFASLLVTTSAAAQTAISDAESRDKPLAATSQPIATDVDALPEDLQPEKLKTSKPQSIDQNFTKRTREGSRNRWDPATLTQTTGLSAASLQPRTPTSVTTENENASLAAGGQVYATDMMSAEDLLNVGGISLPNVDANLAASPLGDGVVDLSSSIRSTLFNLPTDNVNASVFKLDLGDRLCLGTADECSANDYRSVELGYAKNITHGKQKGLNLQLTPRAGLRFDDDSKSALVGALVRIGDNLREGSGANSNTWYVFAGADAEAVTYSPRGVRSLTSGEFHLQDKIIVGDAQAGLGYRIGSADLALTYYKRQAIAEDYSYDEDAAALSLTFKR